MGKMANEQDELGWALITGASSGIGEAFARRLAADGYALILVARRKERLDALATELRERYAGVVETLAADLSQPADVQHVADRIVACDHLALLVNNAGFGLSGSFWETEARRHLDMTQVHAAATVKLTHAALPAMMERQQGGIINVSSIASFIARSSGTMYHATKAFLNAFSLGLAGELKGSGVKVQALCPGFTITGFHDTPEYTHFRRNSIPKFLWMTPAQVVEVSLTDLQRGKVISVPGAWYRIGVFLINNSFMRPIMQFAAAHLRRREH
jgi:short-subunit dehydrogenase